jgi:predicted RNA-binding protein YlxR (DUF448 family)/ribosomal protein L30E
VTGQILAKDALIRFSIGPSGEVVPDIEERLPGRGMWLSARADVINTAVAKGMFSKAARRKVVAPPDLRARIEGLLTRRCIDLIGLARRAGQAVTGFEKVSAGLKSGKGGVILAAHDASEAGRAQVQALARHLPVSAVLNGTELGAAFGRDHAVHGLVLAGRLAASLLKESSRLAGVKGDGPERRDQNELERDAKVRSSAKE